MKMLSSISTSINSVETPQVTCHQLLDFELLTTTLWVWWSSQRPTHLLVHPSIHSLSHLATGLRICAESLAKIKANDTY